MGEEEVPRQRIARRVRLFIHRARRLTRWHYQWLVLHEFLPHTVGDDVTADLATIDAYRGRLAAWKESFASLAARRQAISTLQHPDKGVIYKLFEEIAPRYGMCSPRRCTRK